MNWVFSVMLLLLAIFGAETAYENIGGKRTWLTPFYAIYSVVCLAAACVVLFVGILDR